MLKNVLKQTIVAIPAIPPRWNSKVQMETGQPAETWSWSPAEMPCVERWSCDLGRSIFAMHNQEPTAKWRMLAKSSRVIKLIKRYYNTDSPYCKYGNACGKSNIRHVCPVVWITWMVVRGESRDSWRKRGPPKKVIWTMSFSWWKLCNIVCWYPISLPSWS